MRSRTQDVNDQAALRLISTAAARRMPCPSNDALSAAVGARGAAEGGACLKRLEACGQITIERTAGWRVVREAEFGLKTEGPDA